MSKVYAESIDNADDKTNDNKVFVSRDVIEALQHGSYESKIDRASQLVDGSRRSFLSEMAGDDVAVNVLATFEDRVIVATDEGRVYCAKLSEDGLGEIGLMDVPMVGRQHFKNFIQSKVVESVNNFVDTGRLSFDDLMALRRNLDYYEQH